MTTRSTTVSTIAGALLLLALTFSVSNASAEFGLESVQFSIDSPPPEGAPPGAVGSPQLEAGSHPYRMHFAFAFNQGVGAGGEPMPEGTVKEIQVDLPPGLIGNLSEIPQCATEEFLSSNLTTQACPSATQVGTMSLKTTLLEGTFPVFNLDPPPGEVAQLGVFALITPVVMRISVRTGGDYGLTVRMHNVPQSLPLLGGALDLWGVPADFRHDTLRGGCLGLTGESLGICPSGLPRRPILTLPTVCGEAPQALFGVARWEQPRDPVVEPVVPRDGDGHPLVVHGCEALDFSPGLRVSAEGEGVDSPSALRLNWHLPQSNNPDGLVEAGVREAALTLPPGVSVNPAAADGLGACSPEQIGLRSAAAPSCPDSSRVGSVTIDSPLIAEPLEGAVYLATPDHNEFGSMLAVYLTAQRAGVLVKLAGRIDADPKTGDLSVFLDEIPQLPFSDFTVEFGGGPRATLALPSSCGSFTTISALTPFSASPGSPPTRSSSSFAINRGCDRRFSPSFLAGATSSLAGRRTGLTLRLRRADGEQALRRFSATLPNGLLPMLKDVALCPEPEAAAGSCDTSSRIGRVAIAAGAGSRPLPLLGEAFLTGPYKGAPFGLSIVVPGVAGPFDLGLIVVRATVSVDPRTARLTIATDPLPLIRRGILLRVRSFELSTINRPGLFLAPSSCREQALSARVLGAQGAVGEPSSPFFLGGCGGLRFAPRVFASAGALVSRAQGVDLRIAIRNRPGPQSNLRAVSIRFPKQFSPRLSAIQAACPRATFAAAPLACPRGSVIGSATVGTRVFATPLRGSAYLVSRGEEALPRIVLMLRVGEVKLQLSGGLRISASGRTTARFGSIPDAPISSFVLRLPRGPGSALGASFLGAARGSLCGRDFSMGVEMVAQNGLRSRRRPPVAVTGCKDGSLD